MEWFERLAGLVGLSLIDIAREADRAGSDLAKELTFAQENALAGDAFLSFLFFAILGGGTPEEFEELGVPAERIEAALERLKRLALIDRLKGRRVRVLVERNAMYNKLPMRRTFEARMKKQFMEMDFSAPDTMFASEVLKLSDAGAAMLAEEIERHRREVRALAERDSERTLLRGSWYGILWAARPLDLSRLPRM